jgi:hypothetical protein
MARVTRREFVQGAGAGVCVALESKDAIRATLAKRDRAVLMHRGLSAHGHKDTI